MNKSIVFIFLSLLLSCSSNSNIFDNYYPERQDMDKSILPKEWQAKDTISLEENLSTVILNVSSASISNDGKYIAVVAPNLRSLLLYDYSSGKLLKKFRADTRLSDMYAISGRTPHNLSQHLVQFKEVGLENLIFLEQSKWEEFGFSLKDTLSLFINSFCDVNFFNNQLFVSALIRARSVNSEDYSINVSSNSMVILKLSENLEILEFIPIENNFGNHAIPGVLEIFEEDSYILATSAFPYQRYLDRYDSLASVSKYNRNGDIIAPIAFLPETYTKNRIGYDLLYHPIVKQNENELIILYPLDKNVYNESGEILYNLTNLPFSNDKGQKLYPEYKNLPKSKLEGDEEMLKRLFPIFITNAFISNGNLNVIYYVFDKEISSLGYYYLIQEYSADGKLLSQTKLLDNPDNIIKYFTYDERNDLLVVFRKGKDGWILERVKWEH